MLPANLPSYSNEELARFLDGNSDPLIRELCNRLTGRVGDELLELQEARDNLSEAESNVGYAENKLEEADVRIGILEDLLTKHEIEIPA